MGTDNLKKEVAGTWEVYGLRYDPFYTGPLLVFGGEISKETFIGRFEEIKNLRKSFLSGSSRTLVSGEPGIGKTTFVNIARAGMQQKNFFTTIREIAVQPEWNANDFILNTLFAIFNTIKRRDLSSFLSPELYQELENLVTLVSFNNFSGNINILGTGIGGGNTKTLNNPQLTTSYLQDIFERVIKNLKDSEYKGVIIHYNNLENFESVKLALFFNKIRDFILTEHVHFVFVGDLTVPPVLNSIPRVRSIFNDSALTLPKLSLEEVKKILKKRIETLSIDGLNFVFPYDDETIRILYDLYDGNIRNILNSLSTAIREVSEERAIVLNKSLVCKILSEVAERRWLNSLATWEKEIMFCVLENDEITNSKLAEKLDKKRQNISKVISKLISLSAVFIKRIDGTQKFLSVHPSVKWFLLSDKLKEEEQGKLLDYFK
jgi:Cdc6-like AAA superfamily ATPase